MNCYTGLMWKLWLLQSSKASNATSKLWCGSQAFQGMQFWSAIVPSLGQELEWFSLCQVLLQHRLRHKPRCCQVQRGQKMKTCWRFFICEVPFFSGIHPLWIVNPGRFSHQKSRFSRVCNSSALPSDAGGLDGNFSRAQAPATKKASNNVPLLRNQTGSKARNKRKCTY